MDNNLIGAIGVLIMSLSFILLLLSKYSEKAVGGILKNYRGQSFIREKVLGLKPEIINPKQIKIGRIILILIFSIFGIWALYYILTIL